jgi:flagellar hook-length control protein FliK
LSGFNPVVATPVAPAVQETAEAGGTDSFAQLLDLLSGAAAVSPQGPQTDEPSLDSAAASLPAARAASLQPTATTEAPDGLPQSIEALTAWLAALPDPEKPVPVAAADRTDPTAPPQTPDPALADLLAALKAALSGAKPAAKTPKPTPSADAAEPEPEKDDQDDALDRTVTAAELALLTLPAPAVPVSAPPVAPAENAAPANPPLSAAGLAKAQQLGQALVALGERLGGEVPDLGQKLRALGTALADPATASPALAAFELPVTPEGDLPVPLERMIRTLESPVAIATRPAFTHLPIHMAQTVPDTAPPARFEATLARGRVEATSGTAAPADAETLIQLDNPEQRVVRPADDLVALPPTRAEPTDTASAGLPLQPGAALAGPQTLERRTELQAYQQVQAPPVQVQVAFEMAHQVKFGNSRFEMRLDPPDLGRVEVSLHVGKDGWTHAHLIVERPETLDLMQRDQRGLQQALQQAGVDAGRTSMEFQLRQNPFAGDTSGFGQQGQNSGGGRRDARAEGPATEDDSAAIPVLQRRGSIRLGGINLVV